MLWEPFLFLYCCITNCESVCLSVFLLACDGTSFCSMYNASVGQKLAWRMLPRLFSPYHCLPLSSGKFHLAMWPLYSRELELFTWPAPYGISTEATGFTIPNVSTPSSPPTTCPPITGCRTRPLPVFCINGWTGLPEYKLSSEWRKVAFLVYTNKKTPKQGLICQQRSESRAWCQMQCTAYFLASVEFCHRKWLRATSFWLLLESVLDKPQRKRVNLELGAVARSHWDIFPYVA